MKTKLINLQIHHLNIEVIKLCNQACFYCFNNSGPKVIYKPLSVNKWGEKLMALQKKGLKSVHLTGGEPFAYPYIIELIDCCLEIGLKTSILSNGLRVSILVNRYPILFKQLALAQISLDSLDEKKHNERRGNKNAFRDAMTAILCLHELGISLEISMTVDESNYNEITDMSDFAKSKKAKLIVRPLVLKGRAEGLRPEIRSMQAMHIEATVISDRFCYVTDLPVNDLSLLDKGFLTVLPDGNINSKALHENNIWALDDLIAA